MDETADKEKKFGQLRELAEKIAGGKIVKLSGRSVENTSRLIQELRIHQIELEMQNDELRKTQKELEDSRSKYFSLFDFAPIGYFTLNQKNLIEEANLTGAELLRVERSNLKLRRFTQYIVPDYQDVFYLHRKKILDTNSRQTCELRLVRNDGYQFEVQLISVPCQGPDGSSGHLRIAVTDVSAHVKKVEDEVKAANDLYQSLVENIDMGINMMDADYRIVMINTMMSRWFDKAPRELIGVECFKAFEKRHAVCGHCPGRLAMIDGKPHIADTEGVRDDGRRFPVQIHAFPLFDAEHKPKGFIEVVQDITELKKNEKEIRRTKQQLEYIISATKTGLDIIDSNFNIRYIDPGWQKIYGDPKGRKCYEYFMGRNEVCSNCGIIKALETKSTTVTEEILVKENNRPIQVTTIPFQDEEGKWLVAEVNVDITERKKAENAMRESEKRYRTLFETMDEGFCVVEMLYDPDGKAVDYRFVEINPAFEKHTGLQQALGKTIRQMVPNHDAHWFEIYGKVARTGEAIRFENPAYAMQRYYDVFAFRIGGDGSQKVGVLFNDITEHKKTEQKIHDYQKRLKSLASRLSLSKEHEKQKIASGLHDNVCQRLALSKANLQRFIKSVSDVQTLSSLTSICAEMDKIMEDIHSLTFELGNPVLNELGLTAAVEKYLAEEIREKHGIRFELNSNLKNKELTATIRGCLYRNTHELLWNIVKHASAHQVKVLIHKSADHINVCVEDDGIGFDTGRIAMLPTRTEGFGLFSIREQLEYLGGNIRIESNVGGGTKVTMSLPLNLEESVYL